jgi:fructokinase
LQALRNESALPVFVDINLRSPWWDQPLIWQSLRGARWAKLNEHEIRIALELPDSEDQPVVELAAALRQRYQLEVLIATMGEKGACFVHNEGTQCGEPVPVKTFVDAVGAGDAFSAVTILGLCSGWSYKDIQQRALTFASRICENRGATTRNRALYQELLQQWQT